MILLVKNNLLVGVILLLAWFGGVLFFSPVTLFWATPGLMGLIVWAGWRIYTGRGYLRDSQRYLPREAVLLIPMALSAIANPDIWPVTASRLLIGLAAAAALVLAQNIFRERLQQAIYRAGWLAPALIFCPDNPNILALWPVVFLLVSLPMYVSKPTKCLYVGLQLAIILYLGSRGAILGLMAGLVVFYRPKPLYVLAGAVLLVMGLVAWRPATAGYRLEYWRATLSAWAGSPWLGLGPGGLWARQIIPEPGGGWQIHAHNILITWLETGIIGGILGVWAAWPVIKKRPYPLLAAIFAHGLVDNPLWWPGPLLLVSLIIGSSPPPDKKSLLLD